MFIAGCVRAVKRALAAALACAVALAGWGAPGIGTARAQEEAAEPAPEIPGPPPRRPFNPPRMAQPIRVSTNAVPPSVSVGVDLARGNTSDTSLRMGMEWYGARGRLSWDWSGDYRYAESRNAAQSEPRARRTADQASTALSGRRRFGDAWFHAIEGAARYDHLAGIDRRLVASTGVGRFLIDEPDFQFSLETGVAQVMERIEGEDREWPALRFAQRYERRIVSGARLRQQFEWLANPVEEDEYFLNAEGALEFVVTDRLGFVSSVRNRYAGRPPEDTRPNDLQFSSALKWSF